jgi:tetratricopeptide (TPR) repeat protein
MISLRDAVADFHYHVANLFLRLHRDEAAANAYGRVLRIRPRDAQAQFYRAWCLLDVPRRRQEGITAFQDLLRDSPSAAGFFLLGCGLQQESRHEEAVQAFREAARLENPGTADLQYNYAVSLTALRRFEEAADAYENAVHLNPSSGEAWGNLGAAFAELGRWRDAAPCQDRAMRLAPSLTHGLNLASTLYELNRLDEAERVLRDSLVLDSRSTYAKELLALVLTGQDRYDEAIKLAREICAVNPDAISSRVVLAGVLLEAGHLDEAINEAKAAADVAPSDPGPHCTLGAIYVKMSDGTAALAAFERMGRCLDPSVELPLSSRVSCDAGRGAALSLLGRHVEAMAAFEEVLRTDQGFFERWPEVAPHYQLSSRETRNRTEPAG